MTEQRTDSRLYWVSGWGGKRGIMRERMLGTGGREAEGTRDRKTKTEEEETKG